MTFSERQEKLVRNLVDEHIRRVEAIEAHTEEQCKKGVHLLHSEATGFSDGHCITMCLLCDYRKHEWD